MAKFRSAHETGVSIYIPQKPTPLRIDGTYETDDRDEVRALKASPDVIEIKETGRQNELSRFDPGGNFASDVHRRTLAHLPVLGDDPARLRAAAEYLETSPLVHL